MLKCSIIDLFFLAEDNLNMVNNSIDPILKSLKEAYLNGHFDAFRDGLIVNRNKFDQNIFHYNLGTMFLQEEKYSLSRYHLEKSVKDEWLNAKAWNNLKIAKGHLMIPEEIG